MSDSDTTKNTAAEQPEISGLGTVSVDGKVVYDPTTSFAGTDQTTKTASFDAAHVTAEAKGAVSESIPAHKNKLPINKWGMWLGVILIALGALIFLDVISATLPGLSHIFGGYSFWHFWPLLIIVGGVALAFSPATDSPNPRRNGQISPSQFASGMLTVVIGLVFLGNSLGFVAWGAWLALISYWPILLVVAGLAILSHALKTEWFSVLAYVISIIILLAVASSLWIGQDALIQPFAALAELGSYRGMNPFTVDVISP